MYGINYQQSVYMLVIIILTNRRKDRRQKTRWPTKNYLDNGPDKQHWVSSITNQKEQLKIEKMALSGSEHCSRDDNSRIRYILTKDRVEFCSGKPFLATFPTAAQVHLFGKLVCHDCLQNSLHDLLQGVPPNLAQLLYLFQANNIKDKIKSIKCYITVPPPHNITKNITCSKPIASRECRHRTQWMDESQLKTAKCPFILDMDDIALDWDFYHACILPPRHLATT